MTSTSRDELIVPVPRLPEAQPPLDPSSQPFVGNESVDDNLAECARVAMWAAIGKADRTVTVRAEAGVVFLGGRLASAVQRDAVQAAVEALAGVRSVDCAIETETAKTPTVSKRLPRGGREVAPTPFVYVVRYCSLDEASLSAAVRQAVGELDAVFAAESLPLPTQLYLIYRNRRAGTVTFEIGMPATSGPELQSHTVRAGYTPSGQMLSDLADTGVEAMLSTVAALSAKAKKLGCTAADFWWQSFGADQFRPWSGHPSAAVLLPVRTTLTKPRKA